MSKIRVTLKTCFDKNAEHKKFLKRFDIKNFYTSKTKDGSKFFNFMFKEKDELDRFIKESQKLSYIISILS